MYQLNFYPLRAFHASFRSSKYTSSLQSSPPLSVIATESIFAIMNFEPYRVCISSTSTLPVRTETTLNKHAQTEETFN
jgi:hypothetical protein